MIIQAEGTKTRCMVYRNNELALQVIVLKSKWETYNYAAMKQHF